MPRKLAAAVFAAVFAAVAAAVCATVFAMGAGVAVRTLAPASPHLAAGTSAIGAAAPVRIMALGDSITYGLGSQTRSSYRVGLQQRLALVGLAVDFVGSRQSGAGVDLDNEGHGGWTIRQIAARVDGWLATYQPDVVLLHIGTNDLAFDDDVAHAPERLSALVDRIRAARPAAEIFVQKIVGSRKPWLQKRIDAFNAALSGVVAGKDPRVHLVDQSGIRGVSLYDMVHPNDFGYAMMSFNLYNALAKVLGSADAPWPAAPSPYRAVKAWLCHRVPPAERGAAPGSECRWWYWRGLPVNGRVSAAKVWQTQRVVTETYRVRVRDEEKVRPRYVTRWATM